MPTPDFVLALRRKIGHDPLWLIGVTAYVRDTLGRVLLARRADTGEWALIYGINEPGEQAADTVVREVKEETGVDAVPRALAAVASSSRILTYANGDQAQYMDHLFICDVDPDGTFRIGPGDGENTEAGWFALNDLPSPLAASTVERMEQVQVYLSRKPRATLFSSELAHPLPEPAPAVAESQVSIDPIAESEVGELQALCRETFYDTFIPITADDDMAVFLDHDYATDILLAEMRNPESRYFFLRAGGDIAGYLKVNVGDAQTEAEGPDAFEVQRLYLRKAFKHHGYGTRLMEFAESLARSEGYSTMWLGVWEGNIPAQGLYRKAGFTFFGDHVFQVGVDAQRDLLMRKVL